MSLHVFGAVITAHGVAANNRGENEGNIATLQKVLWKNSVHTTVSSEAIRWALRYYWQSSGEDVNRRWSDETNDHEWQDEEWEGWSHETGKTFIDDDLLGYMRAEGAKSEGGKGHTDKRRGVLEIARAISTTPYTGDITFNVASIGAAAAASKSGKDPVPYGTEVHATRYQYGFSLTPERLREKRRSLKAIDAICGLGEVAGNHSRFLFDFSPESIILRLTSDPAPRLLYCFQENDDCSVSVPELAKKVRAGDVTANELYFGGPIIEDPDVKQLKHTNLFPGVKAAINEFKAALRKKLGIE